MGVKQESQLLEELNKVATEVLKRYPLLGAVEEVIAESLFMWYGCLFISMVWMAISSQEQS